MLPGQQHPCQFAPFVAAFPYYYDSTYLTCPYCYRSTSPARPYFYRSTSPARPYYLRNTSPARPYLYRNTYTTLPYCLRSTRGAGAARHRLWYAWARAGRGVGILTLRRGRASVSGARKGFPGAVSGGVWGGKAPLRAWKSPEIAVCAFSRAARPVDNSVDNLLVAGGNTSFSSFEPTYDTRTPVDKTRVTNKLPTCYPPFFFGFSAAGVVL
jgi:hypothetical protein